MPVTKLFSFCTPCAGVSTIHVKDAGVGSTFPEVSTALTLYVWVPKARLLKVMGLVQLGKGFESKLHWKLAIPTLSVPVNVMVIIFDNVAAAEGLVRDKTALFPSTAFAIAVFGGTVSGGIVFALVAVIAGVSECPLVLLKLIKLLKVAPLSVLLLYTTSRLPTESSFQTI
jgi:hypothetical protein